MALSMVASRAGQFISTIVLARILTKEEFGIAIAAMMVIQILRAFSQLGLGDAFIQRKDLEGASELLAANTLFIITTAANALLFVSGLLLIDEIALWFSKVEGLEPVLKWLFAVLLMDSAANTATSLLRKRLEFPKVSLSEMAYIFTYITVAIALAFLGYGVWSLISGYIAARFAQTMYLLMATNWKPGFSFDFTIALKIFRSGIYLWGYALVASVGNILDRAFTARLLGSVSMGIYGISYNLCTMLGSQIATIVNQVSFPAMAKMQDNIAQLQRSFLKALSHVCLVSVPVATGLFLVAENLIPVVYGSKWDDAVPIVEILAFYGMTLAIASVTNPPLMALGKAKYLLYTSIFHHSLLFIGLWLLADRGIEYVAWVVLLTLTVSSAVAFALVLYQVKCSLWQILAPMCRTGLAAILMASAVRVTQATLGADLSQLELLVLSISVGICSFTVASFLVNRAVSLDVLRTFSSVISSRMA